MLKDGDLIPRPGKVPGVGMHVLWYFDRELSGQKSLRTVTQWGLGVSLT